MHIQPMEQHRWLAQLVGDWTFESECATGPGQPIVKYHGRETVRSLGGLWIICEARGEMPGGGEGTSIITLGYDPAMQRFRGTFVGSTMTHLWVYDGTLDAAGGILTLDTEGPSFSPEGKLAKYQDIIEIVGPDHRTLSSQTPGLDGVWKRFMTAHYRRVT